MDYFDAIRKQPRKAQYFGARFVAERIMHDGMDTNLAVNIAIPPEPQTVDIDYDDDIELDAPTFVLEGPMTNKRASLWKTFTNMFVSEAEAGQIDTEFSQDMLDRGIVTPDELDSIRTSRPDMYKKLYKDYTDNLPIQISPPPMRNE